MVPSYDAAKNCVRAAEAELEKYLKEVKASVGNQVLCMLHAKQFLGELVQGFLIVPSIVK